MLFIIACEYAHWIRLLLRENRLFQPLSDSLAVIRDRQVPPDLFHRYSGFELDHSLVSLRTEAGSA
jgi:hypothetical protein